MIREPTVLILGAGASAPYGLPTGWDLRRQILTGLNAQMFDERLSPSSAHPDAIAEFQQAFRQSGQYSIDAFLEHRVEYMEIGKRAIAATLLPQESTAALFNDPDDDWYKQLLQAMDAPWIQMNDNNIRFVTFNYDRSLEQFLATAFEHRYSGVSRSDAIRLVRTFDIVHVYGSLGSIDPADDDHVPYGAGNDLDHYLRIASAGLELVPEGRKNAPAFTEARRLISESQRVVFLGFGFDKTNVDRLGGHSIFGDGQRRNDPGQPRSMRFAGTSVGLKEAERNRAVSRIAREGGGVVVNDGLKPLRSLDLLRSTLILDS